MKEMAFDPSSDGAHSLLMQDGQISVMAILPRRTY